MALSKDEQKYYNAAQAEIAATAIFLQKYQEARSKAGVTTVDAYDSCHSEGEKLGDIEGVIPKVLIDIFDSIHPDGKAYVLGGIEAGIKGYQAANGGEMPRADMVASALSAGLQAAKEIDAYDSANGTQLNAAGMESNAVVPSATVVEIATRIANSMPLVAYLPNSNGSNVVPIIYGRNIAKNTYGEIKAGDFLDGPGASLQYFDPQFEFAAVQDANDPKTYTLSPTIAYADNLKRTPAPNAKPLPFIGGRVRINVNGVEVGNDATQNHAKFQGESAIIPVPGHKLKIGNVEVKMVSGTADLDDKTISVTFAEELPADTEVTINLIADYEAKDADGKPVLTVPSLDIDLIARQVLAYPMRAIYRATREAIGQMQRELGVDPRGAVAAVVTSKFALEQNIRLLKVAKRRAKGFGRVLPADLGRGNPNTSAYNSTSEQARELLVTISSAKVMINKLLDITPAGHDIFVTDKMSVLFDNLADDTHYRKIGSAVGAPNQIVRIGSIDGNINVYHVPADSGLLTEINDAAEIMIVGRGSTATRNPFVGFVTSPMTVRESNTVDFEDGVTINGVQASELNPLERFADQVVIIEVTNLPVSIVGA
ncbi:hypothetical protein HCY66_11385 [Acinetobacter radioresistens]|uniref:hypothetical protein n=1 Tax=Acinetobacter radioresistens TaxID=40216 RepID=UPI00200664B3|nr:hypothetical protein [Acinetobacter radioresistens]MCK4090668.1 hypothetical protein [Acinetobacter radioresistens]